MVIITELSFGGNMAAAVSAVRKMISIVLARIVYGLVQCIV